MLLPDLNTLFWRQSRLTVVVWPGSSRIRDTSLRKEGNEIRDALVHTHNRRGVLLLLKQVVHALIPILDRLLVSPKERHELEVAIVVDRVGDPSVIPIDARKHRRMGARSLAG
jgi:hypothetical protein